MGSWRRYTFTPPGGRVRDQQELIVRDGPPDRDGMAPACELDGHRMGRAAGAWVLNTWRRQRHRPGAALWVTKYGAGRPGEAR